MNDHSSSRLGACLFVEQALIIGTLAIQLADKQVIVFNCDSIQLGGHLRIPAVRPQATLCLPAGCE